MWGAAKQVAWIKDPQKSFAESQKKDNTQADGQVTQDMGQTLLA
jgi:hypothetical protein